MSNLVLVNSRDSVVTVNSFAGIQKDRQSKTERVRIKLGAAWGFIVNGLCRAFRISRSRSKVQNLRVQESVQAPLRKAILQRPARLNLSDMLTQLDGKQPVGRNAEELKTLVKCSRLIPVKAQEAFAKEFARVGSTESDFTKMIEDQQLFKALNSKGKKKFLSEKGTDKALSPSESYAKIIREQVPEENRGLLLELMDFCKEAIANGASPSELGELFAPLLFSGELVKNVADLKSIVATWAELIDGIYAQMFIHAQQESQVEFAKKLDADYARLMEMLTAEDKESK